MANEKKILPLSGAAAGSAVSKPAIHDGESNGLYAGQRSAQGLYNPANEHDACGIGMICSIRNERSRKIVEDGLKILCNLEHRGAVGADPKAGDGAGILIQPVSYTHLTLPTTPYV